MDVDRNRQGAGVGWRERGGARPARRQRGHSCGHVAPEVKRNFAAADPFLQLGDSAEHKKMLEMEDEPTELLKTRGIQNRPQTDPKRQMQALCIFRTRRGHQSWPPSPAAERHAGAGTTTAARYSGKFSPTAVAKVYWCAAGTKPQHVHETQEALAC